MSKPQRGPPRMFPRYTGLGNVGGFTRDAQISAKPGDYIMVWGKNCFFGYTVSPDGEIWWFANPPSRTEIPRDELGQLTTDQLRERLVRLLAADKTPGARIVKSAGPGFRLTNQYDLPEVPAWHNESMVIIGDAAHAVSPASGQGVSLAAEDAVTLALCLREARSVPAALSGYEQRRRARVQRVVAWGSSMNNTKKQGLAGRMVRDIALPIILKKPHGPARRTRWRGCLPPHRVGRACCHVTLTRSLPHSAVTPCTAHAFNPSRWPSAPPAAVTVSPSHGRAGCQPEQPPLSSAGGPRMNRCDGTPAPASRRRRPDPEARRRPGGFRCTARPRPGQTARSSRAQKRRRLT